MVSGSERMLLDDGSGRPTNARTLWTSRTSEFTGMVGALPSPPFGGSCAGGGGVRRETTGQDSLLSHGPRRRTTEGVRGDLTDTGQMRAARRQYLPTAPAIDHLLERAALQVVISA